MALPHQFWLPSLGKPMLQVEVTLLSNSSTVACTQKFGVEVFVTQYPGRRIS